MLRTRTCCILLLSSAYLFLATIATAQVSISVTPPQSQSTRSPRVRTGTDPVVVDVVVTDNNDQPVKGLRQQDFGVFENNRPQEIRSFEVHDEAAGTATSTRPNLPPNTFTNAGSSEPRALNVVLLDQLNTSIQDQALALHELNTFLMHKPGDTAFAIFSLRNDDIACKPYQHDRWTYGSTAVEIPDWDSGCASMGRLLLVQGFTTDKDRLLEAIQGNDSAQPHPTWLRVGLSNLGGGGGCGFPPGYGGLDYYNGAPAQVIDTTMPSLAELGNFLQPLPGRKNLIWMSDNFDAAPIPQPSDMLFPPKFKGWENTDTFSQIQMTHLTASRIAQARVAIYPVDLTGKNKGIDVKRIPGLLALECLSATSISSPFCQNAYGFAGFPILPSNLFSMGGFPILAKAPLVNTCDEHGPKLDSVANQTGGRAFHKAENIQNALTQAVDDGTDYYTLSYSPSKAKFDGKRRQIRVTLEGKDYHLKYRETYLADDPASVSRADGNAVADVYLPNPTGPMPWIPLRTSPPDSSQSDEPQDPMMSAMGYATLESHGIVFSAHVQPTQDFVKATPEQMEQLQDYESFKAERIAKAMENLTKEEKKTLHKGRTGLGPLDSLPKPDPAFLQPYSIDYSIPATQLSMKQDAAGKNGLKLEVAILAFDALGKKVTGIQQALDVSLSASDLQGLQASGYQVKQTLEVPARTTVLRVAVRDMSDDKIGSLEIPVWAIQSPYRRKLLRLPADLNQGPQERETPPADSTR